MKNKESHDRELISSRTELLLRIYRQLSLEDRKSMVNEATRLLESRQSKPRR